MAIILGRKQYLTQLLIFANTLKKSAEVDTLNDEMSEKQFNELNSIWNYAFASLIREGLVYSYIKFKDTTKDIIRLIIDSVQYDCPASVLRDIFKEDYEHLISIPEDDLPVNNSINIIENEIQGKAKSTKEIELEKELEIVKAKAKKESEKLIYAINHDATTNLRNKKAFLEELETITGDYIIASIDVNNLKFVNDNYGHIAGDTLLRDVADIIRNIFPHCSYRIGGDEFAIVISNMKLSIFENKIENLKTELNNKNRSVAIGYATSQEGNNSQEIYAIADSKMYDDKNAFKESLNIAKKAEYIISEPQYSESLKNITDIDLTNCEREEDAEFGSYNYKYEKMKDIASFVYDIYDLTLLAPGATVGEKIKAIIAPLKMAENDAHPEIFAMLVNNKGEIETYVSNGGLASLKISFGENEYLLRGRFDNGNFKSFIVPTGTTMSMGYNLNKNTIYERRSISKETTNYGHIVFEKYGYIYHIIPISNTNDENGIAQCLICVENIMNSNERITFKTETRNFTTFDNYQILTYWQDSLLCAEVLEK